MKRREELRVRVYSRKEITFTRVTRSPTAKTGDVCDSSLAAVDALARPNAHSRMLALHKPHGTMHSQLQHSPLHHFISRSSDLLRCTVLRFVFTAPFYSLATPPGISLIRWSCRHRFHPKEPAEVVLHHQQLLLHQRKQPTVHASAPHYQTAALAVTRLLARCELVGQGEENTHRCTCIVACMISPFPSTHPRTRTLTLTLTYTQYRHIRTHIHTHARAHAHAHTYAHT